MHERTLFYAVKKNVKLLWARLMLSARKEITSPVPVFRKFIVQQRICKCAEKLVSQIVPNVRTAI